MPIPHRILLALLATAPVLGQGLEDDGDVLLFGDETDLTDLSLEELMNIDVEVTSVSKKRENLSGTAAAVYVITAEDIRRSGAQSIPEALRLAPGLHVARLTNGDYAISARGFGGEFANKMLVLIDGRSVYTPLFSGVFWGIQDLAMQDVERIEVIRGPGGTMWGANAVNGVINIITRKADQLEGSTMRTVVGTENKLISDLRVGGPLGENGWMRAYLKTTDQDSLDPPEATEIRGSREHVRGGFRMDWDLEEGEEFSLLADVFRDDQVRSQQTFLPSAPFTQTIGSTRVFEGGHVLGRWSRTAEDGSSTSVQSSFSHVEFVAEVLAEKRDTFDLDFHRNLPLGERHALMYGLGYRWSRSDTVGSDTLSFDPDSRTDDLFSAFVQDEYQANDDLRVIAGTKVEHNEYTGLEVQPSLRFSLARGEHSTLWGAVSRAVRTPSQVSEDLRFIQDVLFGFPPGFNTIFELQGNDDFESEELLAYELGYRMRPTESSSLDLALFVHEYDNMSTAEFGTATVVGPGIINQPLFFDNLMEGITYGGEVAGQWVIEEDWTLHASYSLLLMDLDVDSDSTSVLSEAPEDEAPKNQFHVRSFHDLRENLELDLSLWYVDNLGQTIDSYTRGDVRLGWRPNESMRLSFGVQGLFHDDEPEFVTGEFGDYYGSEVAVYVQIDLGF